MIFFLAFYLASILTYSDILSGILCGIYSDSIFFPASFSAFCLASFQAFILAFYLASILTFVLAFYLGIFSGVHSGILSGIYFDILSGNLSGILFCLPFYLAFCLAFSPACVRVQAHSTASWAGDMKFRSRHGPLHPELAEEMKRKRRQRRRKEKELHLCSNLETLTWQVGKKQKGKAEKQTVRECSQLRESDCKHRS